MLSLTHATHACPTHQRDQAIKKGAAHHLARPLCAQDASQGPLVRGNGCEMRR